MFHQQKGTVSRPEYFTHLHILSLLLLGAVLHRQVSACGAGQVSQLFLWLYLRQPLLADASLSVSTSMSLVVDLT